ncbi:MAG: T9SS type A sorting domain-containing protein [Saprospiraceae bacterium]
MKKIALCLFLACLLSSLSSQTLALDTTFGVNGKVIAGLYGMSGNPFGIDFVGLPNGKIILGGSITNHVGLEKYDDAGLRETSFSKTFIESDGFEIGVSLQKDGKVLLVSENTVGLTAFAARFDTLGNLDTSFGVDGIAQTFVSHFLNHNVFGQADGRVVVFGDEYGANSSTFSAVRFLPDGIIDSSFATNGRLKIDLPNYAHEVPIAMLEQPDHKLIFAGSIGYPSWNIFMVRILPNGALDDTFGEDGMVIDPIHGNSNAYGLALQTDGKIVLAGDTGPDNQAIVVRYHSDGSRDNYFGEQGVQYLPEANEGVGISIRPDGKILTVNWSSNATLGNLALAQLLPNGQRDLTFGVNGVFRMIDPGMRPRALSLIGNKATVSARKLTGTTFKHIFRFILDLNVGVLNPSAPNYPSLLAYPNPIAEQFSLQFGLAEPAPVSVHLFDLQGKLAENLVQNQSFEQGEHTLSLNCPGHLPVGNYILTLGVAGKKMRSIQIMKK